MKNKQRRILIACCIGIFLCMLDTTVMNITLPAIQSSFDVTLTQLSWALNVYTILFASLTIPLSRFSDYIGKERLYIIALVSFLFSSLLCGVSQNIEMLIIGRTLQGISASIIFPLSMIIGISTTSLEKRSVVVAFLGVSQGFAAAVGPTIGGIVTQYLGWHWVFFINIPLVLISLFLCFCDFKFKEKIRLKNISSIDYLGSFLGMGCMFAITTALININNWGWNSKKVIFLLVLGIILAVLFVINEREHKDPIIPLDIFKNRQFFATSITVILSNIFLIGVMVTLPIMLTNVGGYTELEAALLITPISVMIFIFSPISAILIQRIGPKVMIGLGFLTICLGYGLLTYGSYDTFLPFVVTCSIIGFGYGIIIGPATLLAASDFEGEMLTASQSIIGVVRQIGIIIGVAVFVALLTTNIEEAKVYSIEDANQIIEKSEIPDDIKEEMEKKVEADIVSDEGHNDKGSYITKEQRETIVDDIYNIKYGSYNLEQEVKSSIRKEVDPKVDKIEEQIEITSNEISDETTVHMLNAFLYVYKKFIYIIFISIFVILFFPKFKK